MLVAALVVGAVTAYYLGLKAGGVAAVVAGALFLVAMVVPGVRWTIYLGVGAALVAICWIGPKLPRRKDSQIALGWAKRLGKRLWKGIGK